MGSKTAFSTNTVNMYMLKSVVSVAVFAAYAAAQAAGQLAFTTLPGSIQAGQSYTLEWAGGDATAPVTIILRQGDPNNLDTVSTITTTATGGSYTWEVPSTIVNGADYAFEIVQGSSNNYSGQFAIAGGSGVASASASATAASVSASASAASESASAASASASASESASSTLSRSASRTSATAASTSAPSDNGASGLQSPVALIFGAIAAMLALA